MEDSNCKTQITSSEGSSHRSRLLIGTPGLESAASKQVEAAPLPGKGPAAPIQGDEGDHRTGRLGGADKEAAGADKPGRPGETLGRNRLGVHIYRIYLNLTESASLVKGCLYQRGTHKLHIFFRIFLSEIELASSIADKVL